MAYPKKMTWKTIPTFQYWSGCFLCEYFTNAEYQRMINWCRETFSEEDCTFFYFGLDSEQYAARWIKFKDHAAFLGTGRTVRLCFKDNEDAVLFRLAFEGEK